MISLAGAAMRARIMGLIVKLLAVTTAKNGCVTCEWLLCPVFAFR